MTPRNLPRGDSPDDCAGSEYAPYDGSSADHHAGADVRPAKDNHATTNPDIGIDRDGDTLDTLLSDGPREVIEAVIAGYDHRETCDGDVRTNPQAAVPVEDAMGANTGAARDVDSPARAVKGYPMGEVATRGNMNAGAGADPSIRRPDCDLGANVDWPSVCPQSRGPAYACARPNYQWCRVGLELRKVFDRAPGFELSTRHATDVDGLA